MLPPDSRVLLTEQLRPDAGWDLDHAVATTFTLDLASVLAVPLAFAGQRLQDTSDPIAVMEAVRSYSDRIDVFCQAGAMRAPRQASDLFAFLEPVVHQVSQRGKLFHPKIWLVRYTSGEEQSRYRLLVLSRNLTDDRCWDTCLRLDGMTGTRNHAGNRPLADLLRWLLDHSVAPLAPERHRHLETLAEDIRRVDWEPPEGAKDVEFHALGIGSRRPQVDFSGTRHLVISPFCDGQGLDVVAPADSTEVTVVSRQEMLDGLHPEVLSEVTPYVLSAQACLEQEEAEMLVGLHAKLYVVEYNRQARLVLGSANATRAGWRSNVEFMVELHGSARTWGIDAMLNSGDTASFLNMLEPHVAQPEQVDNEDGLELESLLPDVAAIPFTSYVSPVSGSYSLELGSAAPIPVPRDVRVTVELLTRPGDAAVLEADVPVKKTFDRLRVVDITRFVLLRASKGDERRGTVVRATLVGDPADRLDEILAGQIDTPEKFLRFLMLLLGFSGVDLAAPTAAGARRGSWGGRTSGSEVFELLVRALADRPESIDDLARLVSRLDATEAGRARMPAGFAELWGIVNEARDTLRPETTA